MLRNSAFVAGILSFANAVEYVVVKEQLSWADARAACQAMGEGWDLASIHCRGANDDLSAMADAAGITDHMWIGLNDADSEGTFVWSDGSKVDYLNWANNQPDNAGQVEHYAHIRMYSREWNDLPGDSTLPDGYACGRDDHGSLGVQYADSTLVVRMPEPYTYQHANLFCQKSGYLGLASIHDITTNDGVRDAMKALGLARAFIGMTAEDDDNDGMFEWHWDDNSEVTFENFQYSNEYADDANERILFNSETGKWVSWLREEEALGVVCAGYSFAMHVHQTGNGDWFHARDYCEAQYDRGQLITIHTEARNKQLLRAFTYHHQAGFSNKMWFGLKDDEDENHFYWIDGTPLVFTAWHPNEPNNAGNEDCGNFWFGSNMYGWNDAECDQTASSSNKIGFICASPAAHADSVVTANGQHRVTKYEGTFREADQYCFDTYGTRAGSIEDDAENEEIRLAGDALGLKYIWVGYEATADQVWEWVDKSGHTYENWGEGQPVAHEHARMMVHDNGYWENVAGSNVFAGIVCNFEGHKNNQVKADLGYSDVKSDGGYSNFRPGGSYSSTQFFVGASLSCIGLAAVYNLYNKRAAVTTGKSKSSTAYGSV